MFEKLGANEKTDVTKISEVKNNGYKLYLGIEDSAKPCWYVVDKDFNYDDDSQNFQIYKGSNVNIILKDGVKCTTNYITTGNSDGTKLTFWGQRYGTGTLHLKKTSQGIESIENIIINGGNLIMAGIEVYDTLTLNGGTLTNAVYTENPSSVFKLLREDPTKVSIADVYKIFLGKNPNGKDAKNVTPANGPYKWEMEDTSKYAKFIPPHFHYFTYSASDAEVIATCEVLNCEIPDSQVALTLTANDEIFTDAAYTGASIEGISAWKNEGFKVPTIKYVGRDTTSYAESSKAPVEIGKYTAKITVKSETADDPVTASVDFEIKIDPITQAAIDKINAIGKVELTDDCKAKIDDARKAYDALTAVQKKCVTEAEIKVLTDAEAEYEKLYQEKEKAENSDNGNDSDSGKDAPTVTDKATGIKAQITDEAKKEVTFVAPKSKNTKTVKIPNTIKVGGVTYKVTTISDGAFKNNKKVQKITIPKNIKTIGNSAFSGATKLNTISIPSNVTSIGKNAFKNCSSLTKLVIPAKTNKIGSNAFYGCKKLESLTIKSGKLTKSSISKNAFKGLKKITTIKVPKSKVSAYRKLFRSKGLNKNIKVVKA